MIGHMRQVAFVQTVNQPNNTEIHRYKLPQIEKNKFKNLTNILLLFDCHLHLRIVYSLVSEYSITILVLMGSIEIQFMV